MRPLKSVLLMLVMLLPWQLATAYELGGWDIHGTLSQGWIHSQDNSFIEDSEDGTFDFREFGVNASTPVSERVTLGGQLFARKFGVIGDDDIYLDWLSVTYAWNDSIGTRAGLLKIPYGLYGDTRDIDSLRTQVLLPQGVYAETFRGSINSMVGVAVFGTLDTKRGGYLDYSIQVGQSNINESSGELNRLASDVEVDIDSVDEGDAGAVKLLWHTPLSGLRLSTTLTKSEFTLTGPAQSLIGIPGTFESELGDQYSLTNSIQYMNGRTTFTFENLYNNNETDTTIGANRANAIRTKTRLTAYYAHIDFLAADNLTLGAGYSNLTMRQKTQLAANTSSQKDKQNGYYFSVRYDVTSNVIAKLEQHFSTGSVGLFLSENPDGLEEDWSMTLFKLSYVF